MTDYMSCSEHERESAVGPGLSASGAESCTLGKFKGFLEGNNGSM